MKRKSVQQTFGWLHIAEQISHKMCQPSTSMTASATLCSNKVVYDFWCQTTFGPFKSSTHWFLHLPYSIKLTSLQSELHLAHKVQIKLTSFAAMIWEKSSSSGWYLNLSLDLKLTLKAQLQIGMKFIWSFFSKTQDSICWTGSRLQRFLSLSFWQASPVLPENFNIA